MNYYIPKHFKPFELWPKFEYFKGCDWSHWDSRILETADMLRDMYGPMIANDYIWRMEEDNANQWRGYRPMDCEIGAKNSLHKFYRALDLYPVKYLSSQIIKDIECYPFNKEFRHITCIEVGVPWIHFDTRNWDKKKNGLLIIKGSKAT